ncbi:MAG: ABC transporter substrate-binding protein, partial [Xanthomonadaceae bacterium]|nr:ABC transporter substrate-binding protein [Xanthomonadaceae bacterium]
MAASLAVAFGVFSASAHAAGTVRFDAVVELSGAGAISGGNFDRGAKMAVKEVNAAGGLLGKTIDLQSYDTQSNPGVASALIRKAADDKAYVVLGPGFS